MDSSDFLLVGRLSDFSRENEGAEACTERKNTRLQRGQGGGHLLHKVLRWVPYLGGREINRDRGWIWVTLRVHAYDGVPAEVGSGCCVFGENAALHYTVVCYSAPLFSSFPA